jgi:hypothetical protein
MDKDPCDVTAEELIEHFASPEILETGRSASRRVKAANSDGVLAEASAVATTAGSDRTRATSCASKTMIAGDVLPGGDVVEAGRSAVIVGRLGREGAGSNFARRGIVPPRCWRARPMVREADLAGQQRLSDRGRCRCEERALAATSAARLCHARFVSIHRRPRCFV